MILTFGDENLDLHEKMYSCQGGVPPYRWLKLNLT